ncbi:MAG: glycosyltransferase [Candidatus Dechloromonas phosphoritropha]
MTAPPSIEILPGNSPAVSPLISICIPNYNGSEYIGQCIRSVLAQEHDCEIEIVLHDDASTDNSLDIIREQFPEVHVLASKTNAGFCISNNRMVDYARGKYILLLNNDAILRPGSLLAFLLEAKAAAIPGIIGLPQHSLVDGALVDRGYEFDLFMNPIPAFIPGRQEVASVTGACLWIPRKVWDEIGGFPDWFGSVAEDVYLCHAARLLGYPVVVLDAPGFDHWIGRNLGGGKVMENRLVSTTRRRALSERNKTWVMMIFYPLPVLLFVLPLHLALLATEAVALLLTGTPWGMVRTIYLLLPSNLLGGLARVIDTRRHIQSRRLIGFTDYLRRFRLLPWKLVMLLRYGMPKLT